MEQKKSTVIGNIFKKMVVTLWGKLSQYADQEISKFSIRQLDGFKIRYNIKNYRQHGEAKVINLVVIEKELQEIWEIVGPYNNKDTYNMDESALFQKMISYVTFGTRQTVRTKHNQAWITINLPYNVPRTHKLELWFIKKVVVLCCFG